MAAGACNLFIRQGQDFIIFWRVSSSGKIRTTVTAGPDDRIRVQDNKTYAADYAAIHDMFCSIAKATSTAPKPPAPAADPGTNK